MLLQHLLPAVGRLVMMTFCFVLINTNNQTRNAFNGNRKTASSFFLRTLSLIKLI